MIDLTHARNALLRAEELLEDLNGWELSDEDAVGQGRPKARELRAQASKDLLMLVDQFQAVSVLVKDAYWVFRGEDSLFDEGEEAS